MTKLLVLRRVRTFKPCLGCTVVPFLRFALLSALSTSPLNFMNSNGTQVLEKHRSLYFMDGNVVILAPRQDNSGVLFRVHKSVLSSHSPIFSDMFDVCDPSCCTSENEADRFYDGAPLLHLPDDADHFGSVLEVLYYRSDLPSMLRSPHYPTFIGPILDLARKYGIDRMYAQIVRHLECDWPKTLKDWDKLEKELQTLSSEVERIDDHSPEPAAAIKLAHQFDIPSILPAAFYHLSRLSILDDWEKIHAEPSTRIRNPTKRTARWDLLSAEDFRCLLRGKAELTEFLRGHLDGREFRHTNTMLGKREVCDIGEEVWKDVMDKCLQSIDPLMLLHAEGAKIQRCSTCTKALREKMQVVRAQIWERLGGLFYVK